MNIKLYGISILNALFVVFQSDWSVVAQITAKNNDKLLSVSSNSGHKAWHSTNITMVPVNSVIHQKLAQLLFLGRYKQCCYALCLVLYGLVGSGSS